MFRKNKIKALTVVVIIIMIYYSCNVYPSHPIEPVADNPRSALISANPEPYPLGDDGLPEYTQAYPSRLGRYGIAVANAYLINPHNEYLENLQLAVEKLIELSVETSDYLYWQIPEPYVPFNAEENWVSGLTNSWAALVLLYTGEFLLDSESELANHYILLAKKAMAFTFLSIDSGGTATRLTDGSLWYEEYASEPTSHVLNGFIFIIDVLQVFSYYHPDEYYDTYKDAVNTVKNNISEYNEPYSSVYDLYTNGYKIGSAYHALHYRMLAWLYSVSDDPLFYEYSAKWYFLDHQAEYNISNASAPIAPKENGIENLNNNKYWYGYYSTAASEKYIKIELEEPSVITHINIYAMSGFSPYKIKISSAGNHVFVKKVVESEENLTGGVHKTIAYSFLFSKPVTASSLEISFNSSDILAIRELGVVTEDWTSYDEQFNAWKSAYKW